MDTATSFEIVGENTSQGTGGSITVRLSSLNPTNTILNAFGSYSLSTTLQPGTYRLYALAQGPGYDGSVTFDFDATLEELPPPVPVFGALGHGLSAASLAIAGVLAGRMARRASSDMRS